ncbi:hypothetical protein [Nocardia sp. NPDC003183]
MAAGLQQGGVSFSDEPGTTFSLIALIDLLRESQPATNLGETEPFPRRERLLA